MFDVVAFFIKQRSCLTGMDMKIESVKENVNFKRAYHQGKSAVRKEMEKQDGQNPAWHHGKQKAGQCARAEPHQKNHPCGG